MNQAYILIGGILLLGVGIIITYLGRHGKKARRVTIKHPGIWEQIFGKPRKIIIPERSMLVEMRRPSTREVWFEIHRKPDDGKFEHPDLEKTIFLDGKLSDNGGNHVTIDADKAAQVGFGIGLVMVPTEYEEQVPIADKSGQTTVETRKIIRMETVETREWVGIDGSQTWINEHDVSLKQIAQANMTNVLQMVKQYMTILMVAIVVTAVALVISSVVNFNVAKAAGLIDGFMPK